MNVVVIIKRIYYKIRRVLGFPIKGFYFQVETLPENTQEFSLNPPVNFRLKNGKIPKDSIKLGRKGNFQVVCSKEAYEKQPEAMKALV